jgi:hypothetical protein
MTGGGAEVHGHSWLEKHEQERELPGEKSAPIMKTAISFLALALLGFCTLTSAHAQLAEGPPPAAFAGPGPTAPGLYAGIKDQRGVSISWIRVQGIKDRGDLLSYVRGIWGVGHVDVPLTDMYMMEFNYSDGRIQAEIHLLTGEVMRMALENPFTELDGFWRQNPYSVPLAGIRQIWFRYVSQAQTAAELYSGAPQKVAVEGVVTSLEMHGNGGFVTVETPSGEAVNMRFEYSRLHSGIDLLLNKAPWMVGRTVRALYRLYSVENGQAVREVRNIQLVR